MTVRSRSSDDGFTLVELLVTMTLLGVVLTLATLAFATGLRVTAASDARVEASDASAAALEAVGRGLRTAVTRPDGTPSFSVADRNAVEFAGTLYASCAAPSTIRYSVDANGTLVEQVTDATGRTQRRILAQGVRNTALFTFFRAQPDPDDPTKPQRLVSIDTTPVTGADLGAIRAVDTSLSVRAPARADAPTVTTETRTFLVNANTILTGGSAC